MNSLSSLAPLLVVVSGALLLLLLEVFVKREKKDYLGYLAIVFLLGCAVICVIFIDDNRSYFDGNLILSNLSLYFTLLLIVATIFVTLMSMKYIALQNANHGEFYALLLLALSGMMIMVSSSNLLIIFLGLEVLSVSSYALAGMKRSDEKSSESAVKYFLLGSFASAFLVFGIAFLYGAFRTIDIPSIVQGMAAGVSPLAVAGLGLVLIGFGFKIAVVPFHMWTPDVYEGAPTPVTAFFSVGPKTVGFVVLLRLLFPAMGAAVQPRILTTVLWIIAVLTMVVGNLTALRQTNVKRILAYSSIAHAGYIMVAVIAGDSSGLVFYLTVYLFMNIGAFSAVIALGRKGEEYVELDDFAAVGFKYPWIGATLSVFLLSLAGFPPTGGFLAKFYIFSAAVREGHVALVVIAVLASLVSVFYYLRIIIAMYMRESVRETPIHMENPALFFVLFLCLYGVLQMGLFPGNILLFIRQAVASLPLF